MTATIALGMLRLPRRVLRGLPVIAWEGSADDEEHYFVQTKRPSSETPRCEDFGPSSLCE